MTAPNPHPEFPVLRLLAWLPAATAVMGTVKSRVLPGVFGDRDGIAEAAALMAIVVYIASVACAVETDCGSNRFTVSPPSIPCAITPISANSASRQIQYLFSFTRT